MIRLFASQTGFLVFSFLLLNFSCQPVENKLSLIKMEEDISVQFINYDFQSFCMDRDLNLERKALLSSMVGEHELSIKYAGERLAGAAYFEEDHEMKELYITHIKNELQKNNLSKSARNDLLLLLNALDRPDDLNEIFEGFCPVNAVNYIQSRAGDFHFLLINEGHFNGQNRMLTRKMLRPLWEKGYRYLALETLSYGDESLMERGYPLSDTGYYSKESTFGNLIREALEIGYDLIPYESQYNFNGTSTERDEEQAKNLIAQTIDKDAVGKVLVHVGYSHLFEYASDEYIPLGAFLKQMTGDDILTVDQEKMVDLLQHNHPYYSQAIENFSFSEPSIFVRDEKILIDPANVVGVDIQVFHPKYEKIDERPKWMILDNTFSYKLPEEFLRYEGYQLQARFDHEDERAVPVDQFVIQKNRSAILPKGKYRIDVFNCEGYRVANAIVEAR